MNNWNSDEPLGDIESVLENFRDTINDNGPITIGVMRGASHIGEILKTLDDIENIKVVVFDGKGTFESNKIYEFEKNILNIVSDKFDIPIHLLEPAPVLVKSNNKPWYQDRKHFKNKKSRRKL